MRAAAALVLLAAVAGSATAERPLSREQAFEAGRSFGTARTGEVEDAAASPSFDAIPGYRGAAVPETEYYDLGVGIEDIARQALPDHDVGHYVEQSARERPRFNIDRRDPVVEVGDAIIADPGSTLATTLTGTYTGCREVSVETAPALAEQARCTEWGLDQTFGCTRTLELSCARRIECNAGGIVLDSVQSDMRWTYTYPILTIGTISDNYWGGLCAVYDRTTTFTIEDLEKIKEFTLVRAGFDDWIRIRINGHTVHVGPHGGDRLDVVNRDGTGQVQHAANAYGACELHVSWSQSLNVDISPYLRNGINTLEMRVVVAGGGEGWMRFTATQYCDCAWEEQLGGTCGDYEAGVANGSCALRSEQCTAPAQTRIIDGVAVHRDCWRQQARYVCATGEMREESYCEELRERGCSQLRSACVERFSDGGCHEYEQTYRCPSKAAIRELMLDCSDQLFCLEGDCFDAGYEPNEDFALAASHLGAIEAAALDFDHDQLDVFRGQNLQCEKTVLGFKNCCKDAGWGLDLGLAQCDQDERALAEKREARLCAYVGSYKTGRFFTRRRYESFCCFNSKLGRIIHEQGRPQLDLGWGEAESADCRGLTPEELTRIDFAAVDFSEFFADALRIAGQIARPGDEDLARHLRDRLLRLLPR